MSLLGISQRNFPHRDPANEARFEKARYCPFCGQKLTRHLGDVEDQARDEGMDAITPILAMREIISFAFDRFI